MFLGFLACRVYGVWGLGFRVWVWGLGRALSPCERAFSAVGRGRRADLGLVVRGGGGGVGIPKP